VPRVPKAPKAARRGPGRRYRRARCDVAECVDVPRFAFPERRSFDFAECTRAFLSDPQLQLRTERKRFQNVFGTRPKARILIEASTESEWIACCLEELGHEVIVADPNYAPMYAHRSRRIKTDRRELPRFVATPGLAATVSPSADFPGVPVIRLTCSTDCSMGRGRFLQLLDMPLSPCCP
jgi:hypothetical protein